MSRYKVTAPYPLDLPDGTVGAPGDVVTLESRGDLTDRDLVAVPEPETPEPSDEAAGDEPEPEQPTTRHRKAKTTEESA